MASYVENGRGHAHVILMLYWLSNTTVKKGFFLNYYMCWDAPGMSPLFTQTYNSVGVGFLVWKITVCGDF